MSGQSPETARLSMEEALNVEGYIAMFAERHQPESGGGCTCGFCAWSGEHVALMAYDEAKHHIRVGLRLVQATPPGETP